MQWPFLQPHPPQLCQPFSQFHHCTPMILFAQKQQKLIVGGWVWFLDSREAQSIHPLQKKKLVTGRENPWKAISNDNSSTHNSVTLISIPQSFPCQPECQPESSKKAKSTERQDSYRKKRWIIFFNLMKKVMQPHRALQYPMQDASLWLRCIIPKPFHHIMALIILASIEMLHPLCKGQLGTLSSNLLIIPPPPAMYNTHIPPWPYLVLLFLLQQNFNFGTICARISSCCEQPISLNGVDMMNTTTILLWISCRGEIDMTIMARKKVCDDATHLVSLPCFTSFFSPSSPSLQFSTHNPYHHGLWFFFFFSSTFSSAFQQVLITILLVILVLLYPSLQLSNMFLVLTTNLLVILFLLHFSSAFQHDFNTILLVILLLLHSPLQLSIHEWPPPTSPHHHCFLWWYKN